MTMIGTADLKAWLDEGRNVVLLDVLGKDAFDELHLPGAQNACVYEMTFLDQVEADKDATIVVYGSSDDSLDSGDALVRLQAAGFTDVHRYAGGRRAWTEAGHTTEGASSIWTPRPPTPLADGDYTVDLASSYVEWTGRNIGNRHYGTLRLGGGAVTVQDGALSGGWFELDMTSLTIGDLDGDMAATLIRHLSDEDFFAVDRFPTGRVEIAAVTAAPGTIPGTPNHDVEADVTLRDHKQRETLRAAVWPRGDGVAMQANFDIDRTRWGVNYGSGRLYERLGMHLVNDLVTLQVCVIAKPTA